MKTEPLDLTQEINEPNGSPIPLEGKGKTTLGGLIYSVLTKMQAKDQSEAEVCINLAEKILGKASYVFPVAIMAMIRERVARCPNPVYQTYGYRMLEIKEESEPEDEPAEPPV